MQFKQEYAKMLNNINTAQDLHKLGRLEKSLDNLLQKNTIKAIQNAKTWDGFQVAINDALSRVNVSREYAQDYWQKDLMCLVEPTTPKERFIVRIMDEANHVALNRELP